MKQKRILLYGFALLTSTVFSLVAVRFDVIAAFIIEKTQYGISTPTPVGHWTMDSLNMTSTHALDSSGNNNDGTLQGYELYSCIEPATTLWTRESSWDILQNVYRESGETQWFNVGPGLADLDDDGDFDLLLGEKDGVLFGFKNTGNSTSPTWTRHGGKLPTAGWNMPLGSGLDKYGTPRFGDLDNDGDLDILVGRAANEPIKAVRNKGSISSPSWETAPTTWNIPVASSWNTGDIGDLDGDGDLDAMAADAYGEVKGYVNSGTVSAPNWEHFNFWNSEPATVVQNKRPTFSDFDKDGDLDMFVGGQSGPNGTPYFYAYRNTGNGLGPAWERYTPWENGISQPQPGTNPPDSYVQPDFADLDGDGDDDLMIGYSNGNTLGYKNNSICESSVADHLVPGVLAQALDFDGVNDRVNIGATGQTIKSVSFWIKADDTKNRSILALNNSARITLNTTGLITATGFSSPTIYVDGVAGNILPDSNWHQVTVTTNTGISASAMMIGFANGSYFDGALDDVQIYTQVLTAGNVITSLEPLKYVLISTSKVAGDDTNLQLHYTFDGAYTSSTVTQNSSGTGSNGTLKGGTPQSCAPAWRLNPDWTTPSAGNYAPRTPMPALADIDGDDDLDLMIGTSENNIYGFINNGTVTEPSWNLKTAWNITNHPSTYGNPTFADMDNDGDPDLMIGMADGIVRAYRNNGSDIPVWNSTTRWTSVGWGFNNGSSNASVALGDLDGNGTLDAIAGDAFGPMVAYKNGSVSSPSWTTESNWGTSGDDDTSNTYTNKNGVLSDLDFDGDLDLIYSDQQGVIRVLVNNGGTNIDWTYSSAWSPSTTHSGARIALADIDNDGDQDLFVGDNPYDGARAIVYENIGQCQGGGLAEPTPGKLGQGLGFDGVDDYVDVGNTGKTINSVAFWMKADDNTNRGIMKLNGSANITINASSQIVATGFTSPTIYVDGVVGTLIPDTGWHHVLITTGTGISVSTLEIGRSSGSNFFLGTLDDIRMYNRVLSGSEATQQNKLGDLVIDPNL